LVFEYVFEKLVAKIREDPGSPNIKNLFFGKEENSYCLVLNGMK